MFCGNPVRKHEISVSEGSHKHDVFRIGKRYRSSVFKAGKEPGSADRFWIERHNISNSINGLCKPRVNHQIIACRHKAISVAGKQRSIERSHKVNAFERLDFPNQLKYSLFCLTPPEFFYRPFAFSD